MGSSLETSSLEGRDLDYWVMRADGATPAPRPDHWKCSGTKALRVGDDSEDDVDLYCVTCQLPAFSEHWDTNGMRMIEKYGISIHPIYTHPHPDAPLWEGQCGLVRQRGPSALIAALRALVASKFGYRLPNE